MKKPSSRRYKIKRSYKEDIEPHEVFLDKLAKKKEEETDISERKFEVPISEKITKILFWVFIAVIILFFSRTFYFQVVKGEYFSNISKDNRSRIELITPRRGIIYDRNLKQLVSNKPAFDLVCDKRDLSISPFEGVEEIEQIAEIINKDPQSLKEQIKDSKSSKVLILENISHKNLLLLETKINNFSGFEIEENTTREYITNFDFSHLLGFTSKVNKQELEELKEYSVTDYIGKSGVEKYYEKYLRGVAGKIEIEKDAFERKKLEKEISSAEPGNNLVLHLDSNLQKKLTEELNESLNRVGAKKGVAVALNPQTGGILSLVSLPAFNNNLLSQGVSREKLRQIQTDPQEPFFNRVTSGEYAPGSTIKPLIAAAGLEENIILPYQKINCQGVISVKNPYYPEIKPEFYYYHDWKTHGITDMRKAIAESCNIYFYRLGGGYKSFEGLGVERIKRYLSLFGWGQKTGIDLPAEKKGLIPDPVWKENYFKDPQLKIWRVGDTYHLSIGQGNISATPLQITAAFGAVANGGTLYQPQIVQKIIEGSLETKNTTSTNSIEVFKKTKIKEIDPKVIREEFIDSENLKIVREGMRQAVTSGSGVLLNYLPVQAAAKTGTAETSKEEHYHHWVTVFAPYENPKIVLTILIEDVRGLQSATLPVAKEVLDWYFKR